MFTAADLIDLFEHIGVRLYLADYDRLRARGKAVVVRAAIEKLHQRRDELIAELRRRRNDAEAASDRGPETGKSPAPAGARSTPNKWRHDCPPLLSAADDFFQGGAP